MHRNRIDLWQELRLMTSSQLSQLIRAETRKETPDDALVLEALHIIEERNTDKPRNLGPKSQAAWEEYRNKVRHRGKGALRYLGAAGKAAVLAVILWGILTAINPPEAHAGSFWKIVTRFTDSIFQYVNIGAEETAAEEYVFQSDNPGLQQVYEAVVTELGITEPVVVQWLEEGYVLTVLDIIETPAKKAVHAVFKNGEKEIVFSFDKMKKDLSPGYDKGAEAVTEYEFNGIVHNIVYNHEFLLVGWTRQSLKCFISVECQEDVLKQMIRSIY